MISSDDSQAFPTGLVLLSLESSKRILFFEDSVILGPPWINSIMEKWLSTISEGDALNPVGIAPKVNIKIYFYRADLDIIEEVPGSAIPEFESEEVLVLNLQLERRNSITKPKFYGNNDFDINSKLDKQESKFVEILEQIEKIRDKQIDLEVRILSIEKDDYIKTAELSLWNLLAKDYFKGAISLFLIFTVLQILYTEGLGVNKIIRPLIGLPDYSKPTPEIPESKPPTK